MRNTIIKSHGRTGEGISAPVFAGGGEGGSHGIDLSDGPVRIGKPTNRSARPLKFLPKPLECCHVAHSAGHPPPDQTAERELQSEDEEGELGEGHANSPHPRPIWPASRESTKSVQWTQPLGQAKPHSRTVGPVMNSEIAR